MLRGFRLDLTPPPALGPGEEERAGERAWRAIQQRASHVAQHGHAAEESVLLKRAADTEPRQPMRPDLGHVSAFQHKPPRMRRHVSGRHETRALTGAVRPDDPEDASSADRPAHVAKRLKAAEAHRQSL